MCSSDLFSYSENFNIGASSGNWIVGVNIPSITINDNIFGTFTLPAINGLNFADSVDDGRCYVKYTISASDPSGILSSQDVSYTNILREFKGKPNSYLEIEDGCVISTVYIYIGSVNVQFNYDNDNLIEYSGSFSAATNTSTPLLKTFYKSS